MQATADCCDLTEKLFKILVLTPVQLVKPPFDCRLLGQAAGAKRGPPRIPVLGVTKSQFLDFFMRMNARTCAFVSFLFFPIVAAWSYRYRTNDMNSNALQNLFYSFVTKSSLSTDTTKS